MLRGEERFAQRTKWSSGPFRATNAASLGERPGRSAEHARYRSCHCAVARHGQAFL